MVSGLGVSVWFFQLEEPRPVDDLVPGALGLDHRLVQEVEVDRRHAPDDGLDGAARRVRWASSLGVYCFMRASAMPVLTGGRFFRRQAARHIQPRSKRWTIPWTRHRGNATQGDPGMGMGAGSCRRRCYVRQLPGSSDNPIVDRVGIAIN